VISLAAKLVFIGTTYLLSILFKLITLLFSQRQNSARPRFYSIDKSKEEFTLNKKKKQEKN
jgi:hypothetical protein